MMNAWAWHARAELLACAAGIGLLAAHVAFGLARGVAAADRGARWRRLASAGLALACGIWAALFVVVSGEALPGVPGYDGVALLGGFALTLAAALAAQALLASEPRTLARRAAAAAALGAAVCAAPVLALAALPLQAAPQWPALALPAAWLATTACTGLALALAPATRGALGRVARRRALGAAGLMAATLVGANAAVIASVELAALAAAVPPGLVGAEALTLLALLAAPAVLVLLLLALLLEERFRDLLARARDELQRASYTDVLTGLPNRLLFEERLQRAVHRADRGGQSLALLFVNLDGLKSVNEAFGQAAGDALLRIVGQRLRGLPGLALVARGSGDEFLLLVVERPEADAVARRAASILDEIARPCRVEPREVAVTASIGVALYPEHGALSRLIPHAAAALNAAKRLGGATYCFFDAQMVAGRREEVELLRDLRCAIEQRELELFYQPKIHAPSGQITGAEALMRWHHPRRGIVNPEQFIPLAEHYGLINALGNWVIEDACRQIRAWRNQGLRMRVAINLSVHQLRQADLAERIAAALKRYRLEPRLLTCEITESIAMDDSPQTLAVIEQLAAVGVHLSIDDFGTGYSNLSCLRKLPAEELKIDRGFILDLESSGDARAIVDAVVKLAQAIGLKVVAEGVETEQQQAILAQLGCDELQGYLFARPMSARALAHWAMNHEGPRALDFRASLFGETRQVELA